MPPPNLPCEDLIKGPREEYLKFGVPLYEASIRCDWKAADLILCQKPELVRYAITETGETALHVSASAKIPKKTNEFAQNLVSLMVKKDLELENQNHNTAFYLAAAAGNITSVKILMAKNPVVLSIPGAGGSMLPLYAAALFGYYDVVKYLYEHSHNLTDDGWNTLNRGWLLEKCVENDMFDIAQQLVEKHPELTTNGNALRILAGKPEAFVRKTNFTWVLMFLGIKKGAPENENNAFPLLTTIWKAIAKMPKKDIDRILRGPPDGIEKEVSAIGWSTQSMRLEVLVSEHVAKMKVETNNIQPESANQDNNIVSGKENQALRLENLIFRYLAKMHDETHDIIRGNPTSTKQDKNPSREEYQSLELQKLISRRTVDLHTETQQIIESTKEDDKLAVKLREVIFKHIEIMQTETLKIIPRHKQSYSSRVLFLAAEMGNTNFIVELIRGYPDLIWKINDNNQTIFHIAVKHRHEGIYNLMYEIGAMKDMITPLKDNYDNNMLHLVGMSPKQKKNRDVSGVGLQMQRELLWFREVQKMIPPSYRERKNKENLTPHEVFTKEHKDIVRQDEKWMKAIAGQCMVVAALIATMVFTAAYTIPGGYNQDNGIPIFHSGTAYKVFVLADAISFISSTTSILYMFVSVFFSSNYSELDFLESLPKKLILGLLYLSVSIISMLIAFSVSFFILYRNGTLWMPILISVFALIPFYRSFKMYSILLDGVYRLEYGSSNLFRPKKSVLYYENPRV